MWIFQPSTRKFFNSNAIYAGLYVTGIIVEQVSTVPLEGGLVTSERGFFAVYRYMISLTVRLLSS